MTGCDFPAVMQGRGSDGSQKHWSYSWKVLGSSLLSQQPLPFPIPIVLIHYTGNPTNRWHLGRKADKLAPTCRSTKLSKQTSTHLPRAPQCGDARGICHHPPSSLLTAQWLLLHPCLVAGIQLALPRSQWQEGKVVLNQVPRRGNSGRASTERYFFHVSTKLWLGGLAASLKEEGFLGSPLNIHLFVIETASSSCLFSPSAKAGVCPPRKFPSLTR